MRNESAAPPVSAPHRQVASFEDLIAWQKARALVKQVYLATKFEPFSLDYGLARQIQRAAVSVPSNIAEGFERKSPSEFHLFLSIAKGSCAELRTQLYLALDLGYLDETHFTLLLRQAEEVTRVIAGLRTSVERLRDEDGPQRGQPHQRRSA